MNLIDSLKNKIRIWLSIPEMENTFLVGTTTINTTERDRPAYTREEILEQCLDAWRYNPLARRIVELTTQYTIGTGFEISAQDQKVEHFILEFWNHRLNEMDSRLAGFSDELARTGNLFLLISTDPSGMSYIRAVPADKMEAIQTAPNDPDQETLFRLKSEDGVDEGQAYEAYDPNNDEPDENSKFKPVMVHYAVNRPVGALWGEPDLSHLLKWLGRYTAWLEDRVRLNRFRNAFLYVVKASFVSEAARKARQAELAANPPTPGSILVTDESEEWTVMTPKLEALDANTDGLSIKKMIAAGAGVPLHFLAEPEHSTKTTAESAGEPTYRKFEMRQQVLVNITKNLLQIVLGRRCEIDKRLDREAVIEVHASDISARDNSALASAGSAIKGTALELYEKGMIDKEEVLRLVYKYLSEEAPESVPTGDRPTRASPWGAAQGPETGKGKSEIATLRSQ